MGTEKAILNKMNQLNAKEKALGPKLILQVGAVTPNALPQLQVRAVPYGLQPELYVGLIKSMTVFSREEHSCVSRQCSSTMSTNAAARGGGSTKSTTANARGGSAGARGGSKTLSDT